MVKTHPLPFGNLQSKRILRAASVGLVAACTFSESALAQVVIPHGDFGDGVTAYIVAAVSLLLLCFAVWQYFRSGR
ncbi:MAG TPA: hypothetical protein VFP60_08680 [Pseudolabrys sp.]|nr:hypothetical protein [Pseudolabrys sp.]